MHSSIISKIRILKPRKKSTHPPKTFTLRNDARHSSQKPENLEILEQSPPPPLIHKNNLESESIKKTSNDQSQKWLPVYIVNVPKSGIMKVTKGGNASTSKVISSKDELPLPALRTSFNKNVDKHTVTNVNMDKSQAIAYKASNITTISARSQAVSKDGMNENMDTQNENKSTEGTKLISCFLCSSNFTSVAAMQSHYLDSHKQKKRSGNLVVAGNRNSNVPSNKYFKPINSQDIFDCNRINSDEIEPKCPICSIDFKSVEEVKEHMMSVHCYKCSECKNMFYTLYQFTDHKCSHGNKLKKNKLKKKKIKVKLGVARDKDPLSLSPKLSTASKSNVRIVPKIAATQSLGSQPSAIHIAKPKLTMKTSSSTTSKQFFTDINNLNGSCEGNLVNLTGLQDDSLKKSYAIKFSKQSLLNYTLEELTSKEFNKMKLTEILQNPNISVKYVNQKDISENSEIEFFSCGRCNVLCEDKNDFTDHIEECLRLSNVSLISSIGPPKRIIKLKSEVIPKKLCNYKTSSINQKLLSKLKNYIDSDDTNFFKDIENDNSTFSEVNHNMSVLNHRGFFHPDIKGNISIKKIEKSAFKTYPPSAGVKVGNYKKPMVVIPIDHNLQSSVNRISDPSCQRIINKNLSPKPDDHYPEISIIDKSNCVTYKFVGSGADPILRYEANTSKQNCERLPYQQKSNGDANNLMIPQEMPVAFKKTSPSFQAKSIQSIMEIKENLLKQSLLLKSEPSTSLEPNIKIICNPDTEESEQVEEKYSSSLELALDEEEIKMEVEDEIVTDSF